MARIAPLALLLLLPCLPAMAQDIAAQYAAADATFGLPGATDDRDPIAQQAAVAALIPTLAGRWIPVSLLADGSGAIDADAIAQACTRQPIEIAPTSAYSLDWTLTPANPERPGLTVRLDYTGFNSFQRSRDTAAALLRLALPEGMAVPPPVFLADQSMSRVALFHPSPDILVLQPLSAPTEIYARCPA